MGLRPSMKSVRLSNTCICLDKWRLPSLLPQMIHLTISRLVQLYLGCGIGERNMLAFIKGVLSVADPEILLWTDGYPSERVRGFRADRKKLAADCKNVCSDYRSGTDQNSPPQL